MNRLYANNPSSSPAKMGFPFFRIMARLLAVDGKRENNSYITSFNDKIVGISFRKVSTWGR